MKEKNKGITLIALVITIIVMLILVAVTISMAVNGGLFDYAGKAVGDTQNSIDEEQQFIKDIIDDYIKNEPMKTGIKITPTEITLKKNADGTEGEEVLTGTITASLYGMESEPEITWETSSDIITLSSKKGKSITVTAVGTENATATVTAKCTYEGKEYTQICEVTLEIIEKEETYTPISTADSYVGCYADFNGDGTPEGIIYADLAHTVSGRWENDNWSDYAYTAESGFKKYYIKEENYTEGVFYNNNENEKIAMIAPVKGTTGKDRFYVMALEDIKVTIDGTIYSTFYWYYNASGNLDRPVGTDYNDFGEGKSNTIDMLKDWNVKTDNKYGEQHTRDLWGVIQDDKIKEKYPLVKNEDDSQKWFVPSKAEWAAFGDCLYTKFGVSTSNYEKYEIATYYWASSQLDSWEAWYADFYRAEVACTSVCNSSVDEIGNVRLSATF